MIDQYNPTGGDYQDPFASPFNPINQTAGVNWQMNKSYMTPGYMANYRPAYSGESNAGQSSTQSWWRAFANNNPFSMYSSPIWQNADAYRRQSADELAFKPVDHAMNFSQNWVTPTMGFLAANSLFGMQSRNLNNGPGSQYMNFAKRKLGMPTAGSLSFGGKLGQNAMGGLGRGLFGKGVMANTMGFAGGFAGSLALPMLGGMALSSAVDSAFFDPYISTRRGMDSLQSNYANVHMKGGGTASGLGMSSSSAQRVANMLTEGGIRDTTFKTGDYNIIADYASQAGMLNAGDVKELPKKVKDIAQQVKIIMAIANEPDVKEAVQMLGKLKSMGASTTGGFAGSMFRHLGSNATLAGTSVKQMMDTVGQQGSMIFQQNGMSGLSGMTTASRHMGMFASQYRTGGLSEMMSGMLGGPEGMTQYATEGTARLASSNMFKMMMTNKNLFGMDPRGSVVGTIAGFGKNSADKMLSTQGYSSMFGDAWASNALQNDPTLALNPLLEMAKDMPGTRGKNGKFDAGALASIGQSYGLDGRQMYSMLKGISGAGNKKTWEYMMGGLSGDYNRTMKNLQEETGNYGGPVGRFAHDAKKIGRGIIEKTNPEWVSKGTSWLSDKYDESMDQYIYGRENHHDYARRKAELGSDAHLFMRGKAAVFNGKEKLTGLKFDNEQEWVNGKYNVNHGQSWQTTAKENKYKDIFSTLAGASVNNPKLYETLTEGITGLRSAKGDDKTKYKNMINDSLVAMQKENPDIVSGMMSKYDHTSIPELRRAMIKDVESASGITQSKTDPKVIEGYLSSLGKAAQDVTGSNYTDMSDSRIVGMRSNAQELYDLTKNGFDSNDKNLIKRIKGLAASVGIKEKNVDDGDYAPHAAKLMTALDNAGASLLFQGTGGINDEERVSNLVRNAGVFGMTVSERTQKLIKKGDYSKAADALGMETASFYKNNGLSDLMIGRKGSVNDYTDDEIAQINSAQMEKKRSLIEKFQLKNLSEQIDTSTMDGLEAKVQAESTAMFKDSVDSFGKAVDQLTQMSFDVNKDGKLSGSEAVNYGTFMASSQAKMRGG